MSVKQMERWFLTALVMTLSLFWVGLSGAIGRSMMLLGVPLFAIACLTACPIPIAVASMFVIWGRE